ncbi:MAG: hypothetical protein V1753_03885 [Pseudomonadota bacterium]
MPRRSRIDAPHALHHIIIRGIERRKILKLALGRLQSLEDKSWIGRMLIMCLDILATREALPSDAIMIM